MLQLNSHRLAQTAFFSPLWKNYIHWPNHFFSLIYSFWNLIQIWAYLNNSRLVKVRGLIFIRKQRLNKITTTISVHSFARNDLLFRRRFRTKRSNLFKIRLMRQQSLVRFARLRHPRKYTKTALKKKWRKKLAIKQFSSQFFNHKTFFSPKQSFRKQFRFIIGGLMSPYNLSNKLHRTPEEGIIRTKLRKNWKYKPLFTLNKKQQNPLASFKGLKHNLHVGKLTSENFKFRLKMYTAPKKVHSVNYFLLKPYHYLNAHYNAPFTNCSPNLFTVSLFKNFRKVMNLSKRVPKYRRAWNDCWVSYLSLSTNSRALYGRRRFIKGNTFPWKHSRKYFRRASTRFKRLTHRQVKWGFKRRLRRYWRRLCMYKQRKTRKRRVRRVFKKIAKHKLFQKNTFASSYFKIRLNFLVTKHRLKNFYMRKMHRFVISQFLSSTHARVFKKKTKKTMMKVKVKLKIKIKKTKPVKILKIKKTKKNFKKNWKLKQLSPQALKKFRSRKTKRNNALRKIWPILFKIRLVKKLLTHVSPYATLKPKLYQNVFNMSLKEIETTFESPVRPFSCHLFQLKQPTLWTQHKLSFLLDHHAFLFTVSTLSINSELKTRRYFQAKKLMYSFAHKTDIHKFIMRKYVRTKVFKVFNENFQLFSNDITSSKLVPNFPDTWTNVSLNTNSIGHFLANKTFLTRLDRRLHDSFSYTKPLKDSITQYSIKRIRFKPGYMNIWRKARTALKHALQLNFRYQHKLTKYLARFKKVIGDRFLIQKEMQLINILIKSRLIIDKATAITFLEHTLVFVNGVENTNAIFLLYAGDFIQLIVSLKYYIYYKWLLNWSLKQRLKLRKQTRKKLAIVSQTEDKKRSTHYAEWMLKNKRLIEDVSKFLEVDFLTLSIFIVYEPTTWAELTPYFVMETRYNVINMYNWKYIT